ncbi:FAD-dependent oxidoreductase [Paenibacillus sp. HWE-109]|uniref:FAD-dependent oxidoreductase n=1 Tax=Paenibacillus sp. HWE-109 TaxID=1306526 RepID=UPI001EDF1D66|nr:FAD-dependent oxidoreductase [Paenibacillus sp. HWE-109]UKS24372.1 FAD-dependent oxidoreductase [Paenibacillus sp. HWE-109]
MATNYYELNRHIPLYDRADLVVIGGGPSGVAAAIAGARCGKKVILLEHTAQLGGMGTIGNVSIFMKVGNCTGIYREIIAEFAAAHLPNGHEEGLEHQFSPFRLRYYLNQKLERENVKVCYHTSFVSSIIVDKQMKAVIINSREGLRAVEGAVFLDCTGDARVAIESGASYTSGRESDGMTQPMTLMFMMQNTGEPVKPYLPEGCYYYDKPEDLPQGRHLYWERMGDGTLLVNMSRVKGNGAKIEDINYAEKECLKQAFSIAHYLQRNGFENYAISHVASQTGVRETNQLVGLYTLTEDDLTAGRRFTDVVAQTNYEIDIHSPDGSKVTDERHIDGYDIPYRCLVPVSVEGLLVAGRAISATHVAMSSMRIQATCYALGQAAGVAAAISIDSNCQLRDVSIDRLHEELRKQGVHFVQRPS